MVDTELAQLRQAERAGLRLYLRGRQFVLLLAAFWFGYGLVFRFPENRIAFAAIVALLLAGWLHRRLLRSRAWRSWHSFVFYASDIVDLGLLAALAPLSSGGDVPQLFVFRAYGVLYFVPFIAMAALSLRPAFVLGAGVVTVLTIWALFLDVTAGMPRQASWSDLAPGATAEAYMALLLDPAFVGRGNRMEESLVILASSGIIAVAVRRARELVLARARAEARRRHAQAVFGRYVPEQVAQQLLDNELALRPTRLEASILMSDIEGFTNLAERLPPERVVAVLDAFFAAAAGRVSAAGGVVIGYAGDALLASFNAPLGIPDHADRAIAAGRSLLDLVDLESFAGERLAVRVGIATGPVAAGSVGGEARRAYTVYGATVNLAQRLEEMNKETATRILVADSTAEAARAADGLVSLGRRPVRGRTQSVEVWTFGRGAAAGQSRLGLPISTDTVPVEDV